MVVGLVLVAVPLITPVEAVRVVPAGNAPLCKLNAENADPVAKVKLTSTSYDIAVSPVAPVIVTVPPVAVGTALATSCW